MMKIVLLMPQSKRYGKGGDLRRELRYPPLTLTTLAALVPTELEAEISCIDEFGDDFDPQKTEADIVGITVITGNAPKAYRYSQILRSRGITVVLGGVHVTLCPDEAINYADAIVVGYAEETWPQLLRDWCRGKLKARYDEQPKTADGYPWPRRDLLDARVYGPRPRTVVQATRGCVYKCTFCVVPSAWPNQYQRNPEDVAREVASLPGKTFILIDLSPTSDQEYFGRLCDAFAPLGKYWGGLATLDVTDNKALVERMSRSGCRGLLVGLESQNPQTLKVMGKSWQKPQDNLWRIQMLHDYGIGINGCFVFGVDGDTERVFDDTLEFVMQAKIDLPRFAIATPFPNTPLYRLYEKQGRLLSRDWGLYDGQHVVFEPKGMSAETLYEGTKRTWKEAYSLSSTIRRILGSAASRNPTMLAISVAANLGYRHYAGAYPGFMPIPCEGQAFMSSGA